MEKMTVEEFNALTPEEQTAILTSAADMDRQIQELTAERDSLRTENEEFSKRIASTSEELKKTKELNYTLARHASAEPVKDTEELLAEMFIKKEERK